MHAYACHDPDFLKELKFHHAFMAYCISNLFQSFGLYSSENIVKCPLSQVLIQKLSERKCFINELHYYGAILFSF
jgi:hypothetical protein